MAIFNAVYHTTTNQSLRGECTKTSKIILDFEILVFPELDWKSINSRFPVNTRYRGRTFFFQNSLLFTTDDDLRWQYIICTARSRDFFINKGDNVPGLTSYQRTLLPLFLGSTHETRKQKGTIVHGGEAREGSSPKILQKYRLVFHSANTW